MYIHHGLLAERIRWPAMKLCSILVKSIPYQLLSHSGLSLFEPPHTSDIVLEARVPKYDPRRASSKLKALTREQRPGKKEITNDTEDQNRALSTG